KSGLYRVQVRLDGLSSPAASRTRHNPDFPLRSFTRCGQCGGTLTGGWSRGRLGKRYPYYECHRCRRLRVRKADMESAFLELVARLQPQPKYVKLFNAIVLEVWRRRQGMAAEERDRLQGRVDALRKRLRALTDLLLDE